MQNLVKLRIANAQDVNLKAGKHYQLILLRYREKAVGAMRQPWYLSALVLPMVMLHLWRSPFLLLVPVSALWSWADQGTGKKTVRNINLIPMLKFAALPDVAGISASTYFTTHDRWRNSDEGDSTPSHFVARRVDSKPAVLLLLLLLISMSYKYSAGLCVRSFTDAVKSLQSMRKRFSFLIWENSLEHPDAKYCILTPLTNHFQTYSENSRLPCMFSKTCSWHFLTV